MSSPAPKSPEQSEKSKKYDRQLRLWGDHGQKFLENSKICLINATALGTEILKSLVLPGIGSFTIVDGEKVTDDDIGSNFFIESDSIGMSRAQVATQNLLELNPDVRGDYIDESVDHIMAHSQDFFDTFSVVIATCLPEKVLMPLSRHLWEKNVPLIVCRSVGFLGYIRIQVKEHTIIEAHPDNENHDLRLDNPWPALKEHLDKVDVTKLDNKERSHVPAVVILYYYLAQFKSKHGHLPKTRAEKEEVKKMITESPPPDEHGIKNLEENFKEAIRYINTCINPIKIPPNLQAILEDDSCINVNQNSSPFWVLCAALKEFVEKEGAPPLKGTLPDMAADTSSYITLQQLYQKQAQTQCEIIYRRALEIARNLGLSQETITESEAKLFCKHASELHVIRGSCIADEYQKTRVDLTSCLEDPDSLMFHYITLRGLERFISEFNSYPGQLDDHVEPDVLKLKGIIGKLLGEWGCSQIIRDERVHEVCRYGGAELHSVSAILGGCAAHEAIKLITLQYKPLNNTFIYDAITSTSASFTL
ncbi:nedd8-activating enzyme E1 regulatory subunit [Tribolium castaneum]|uniref:NEDD8-activating enzyme E1 regulatory subunit n=1 Tax=Tribolium castaneum TaxID=7070 RepID=D6WGG4_TRICA|nr:PREDICTED: nedd8-activating enzyme E1 regulatory subunit [Tribolium castaneum]EFA00552.1 Nedd8-activating enzyme E1 regulatory subunit-like Protein [Tribolium castaneum]|eukprot:XP_969394.1 PREDICTED: nedd8-activating enzyme E1 regulatory subunit [Tribolium castaneum]